MAKPAKNKQYYIEEELLLVKNSGEIPEIAYHGSLYYLTKAEDGPRLSLTDTEVFPLKQAVFERYRKIMLRDLNPEFRDKSIFRGLQRCAANWQRFTNFCKKEGFTTDKTEKEIKTALCTFMKQELADVQNNQRQTSINCSLDDMNCLLNCLKINEDEFGEGWKILFKTP